MENQQPEALRLAEWCEENSPSIYRQSAETAKELRRLHARVQELEAMLDAVGAGGVSAQRITQADARYAERWSEIGKSIERACGELPEDFEINIHLENGAGTVVLLYPNGEECENFPHDDGFAGVVNAAIDAAIAAERGRSNER